MKNATETIYEAANTLNDAEKALGQPDAKLWNISEALRLMAYGHDEQAAAKLRYVANLLTGEVI